MSGKSLIPPHDLEAEQMVLGAMLKIPDAAPTALGILPDENAFYSIKNRLVYRTITELFDEAVPIDLPIVADRLRGVKCFAGPNGSRYLNDLHGSVFSARNLAFDANTVLQHYVKREMINLFNDLQYSALSPDANMERMLDRTEARLFDLRRAKRPAGFMPINRLVNNVIAEVEEITRSGGRLPGDVNTGFWGIDVLVQSFKPGELILLAGRPSMGKTALALNIAENIALCGEGSRAVGVFSMEMSASQLLFRLICGRSRVSQQKIRSGMVARDDWIYILQAVKSVMEAQIFIDDSSVLSLYEFRSKARHLKAQHNVALFIVDYIQLMTGPANAENRNQEMAGISQGLKSIAKELQVPIMALSQLSRQVEMRNDKRPVLSDLRDSGALEQDADIVMLLFRPEFYMTDLAKNDPVRMKARKKAEVIIAKQRNGPTGQANLEFIREQTRFQNVHDLSFL
jgi:replicative DNA helicase